MAGTLVANTINTDTGLFSTNNVISGVANAWVKFQGGNGNTAGVILGSFNVSSVTVIGTGNYTVNFTTAMPNTNYAMAGNSQYTTSSSGGNNNRTIAPYSYATSGISVNTGVASTSGLENPTTASVVVFSL
jgi:hypothetical protein